MVGVSAGDALRAELPNGGAAVDGAVLEYMCGLLADTTLDDAEMRETLVPLLLETGTVDEAGAQKVIAGALRRMHGGDAGGGEVAKPRETYSDAPRKLEAPVILLERVKAFEETLGSLLKRELNLKEDVYTNKIIETWTNGEEEVLDEAAMKQKAKIEKKLEKTEKRGINRERSAATERNELMERLTRAPVVIHPKGELSEYVGGGPTDIILSDITMELGGLVLLENTSLTLVYGRRYGLVGRNGIGKTTFLKHMAAKAFPNIPRHLQILHIEQEVPASDTSVLQTVLNCDIERESLLAEERDILKAEGGDGMRLTEVYRRLEEIDAQTAVSRASAILAGLGFTPEMQQRPTREFSGGWRSRVSLAIALFIQPDLLMLDEPTNNLDVSAVIWLEEYLNNWKKMLIVVSHARDFLENVVTDILHLQNKTITRYKGNYTNFEERLMEIHKVNSKAMENQDRQIAHMQAFVDRWRVSAARASMAQSRLKAIAKIERISAAFVDPEVHFQFPEAEPLGNNNAGIQLINVAFSYAPEQPPLFENVDLTITPNSRVCLVGPNGIGKSTLLKVMFDELKPTRGLVNRNPGLRVERFTQHHVDQLVMNKSPLETFRADHPTDPVQKIRAHLGAMGITGKLALQPIYTLSGGQKSRVALARITYSRPHVLLLDEITNFLDQSTIEALIAGLAQWNGGMFLISHDQFMISAVCDELWIMSPGKVVKFNGDFDDYRAMVKKTLNLGH